MKLKKSKAFLLLAFTVCLFSHSISAQKQQAKVSEKSLSTDLAVSCKAGTEWFSINLDSPGFYEFDPSSEVEKAVEEVLKFAGYLPKTIKAQPAQVSNTTICWSKEGEIYFLYNRGWVFRINGDSSNQTRKWINSFLVAHQLAHINFAHILKSLGSNPQMELEAYEYAGEILAKMGATLEQAQLALSSPLMQSEGSVTHPPTKQGLEAVEKGWKWGRMKKGFG